VPVDSPDVEPALGADPFAASSGHGSSRSVLAAGVSLAVSVESAESLESEGADDPDALVSASEAGVLSPVLVLVVSLVEVDALGSAATV
jgi:hypothetical protein